MSALEKTNSGFTLIQLSIILTVASLVFVAALPGIQTSLKASATSVTRMNAILNTMRGYMAAKGVLPCPADPTQAIGSSNFGVAAAGPGTTNNCTGGSPSAAYADATQHIAIGMVPVKTLGLSYADALDGYGRDITYAVDTNATGNASGAACWGSSSLTGAITVNDNGSNYNTIAALISHGADGYGAWLPLSGTSGTASRFDNGSTDTAQADNAQVAHGGGLTANTTFASFVRKAATSTFDDSVVYKSNLYTLNTLPASTQVYPTVTPPSNGTYTTGNTLTFTITYASNVTVIGTPRLTLSALGTGSIGTGNVAYAAYQSGSGSNTLTFSYTVQSTDSAPNGLSMNAWIDLNGGNISGGSICFTAPSLTGVLIAATYYRTVTIDHTKVGTVNNTDQSNFPVLFSGTYSYLATTAHGGMVTNANGYDITFTSDQAGNSLLPFERESWNATTGASVFWVQVPTVSHSTDTVIYLHYGNSSITTDQSNKTGTWDSNFKAVWHLDESGNGTSGEYEDSTSNGNNATGGNGSSSQTPSRTTGLISYGQSFTGSSNQWIVNTATSNLPAINGNQTVSFWYNESNPSSNQIIFDLQDSTYTHANRFEFCGGTNLGVYGNSGCGTMQVTAADPSNSTWHLLTYTWNGTTNRLYFDGTQQATSSTSPDSSTTGIATFGAFYSAGHIGSNGVYTGLLDEVRISNTVRSADWIKTEYNNQNAPDKATYGASGFYTIGSQMSR